MRTETTSPHGTASGPGSLRLMHKPFIKPHLYYIIACIPAYNCIIIHSNHVKTRYLECNHMQSYTAGIIAMQCI